LQRRKPRIWTEKEMSKRLILMCIILLLLVISLMGLVSSDGDSGVEDKGVDIEEFKGYAEKLVSVKNYKNAGILYDKIASRWSNKTDWDNASRYYILACDNFLIVKEYEHAGASYLNAGDCYYEKRDCANASKYYLLAGENYKKIDPNYDDSWIEEKIEQCKERSLISTLLIVGILLAVVKFAAKTAFGCAFATLRNREIIAVASIYFAVPFAMSVLIGVLGGAYKFVNILIGSWVILGVMHLLIALFMLVLGLYTIKKWVRSKKDITRKTFLLMAIPCPICGATMFIACAFLIIMGMGSLEVGMLVGGVFFVSITGMTFGIRKLKERKNLSPSSFGGVMMFFGLLYFLSLLLIPAYLPVRDMELNIAGIPASDVLIGLLFMVTLIAIGFIKNRCGTTDSTRFTQHFFFLEKRKPVLKEKQKSSRENLCNLWLIKRWRK
jgi:predicted transporter